jgi:RNA polymerase sigma factor (sigma-70 family)
MTDDATLLRRYAETRAQDAFAELVRRNVDAVYSAALRRVGGDAHLAQDVTQQVFAALARKAETVATHPVLSGWLYTTTRNEAANVVRSERRRKARDQEAHAMHDAFSKAPGDADWTRVAPILDEVIDELTETDRRAVLLRFVDRRPFAEIGGILRVSEDAARMRVDRALEKLRVLLARRGISSSATALGAALTSHVVVAAPAGLAATVTGAALASVAATSGPVALIFQFMITSKLATSLAAVAVLAIAFGTATHESAARQAVVEALAVAAAETARLDQQLRELQLRATAAEQAAQQTRASLAVAEAPATKTSSVASNTVSVADPVAAGRDLLARHPEVRELWDERERANIAAKFGPVFRMLNLNAAEQEQLATIAIKSMSGSTFLNGPDGMISLLREPTITRAEADAQVQAILGPERYARFQALASFAPTFDLTVKLASALYRTEPLTPEQTDRVMQIFAQARLGAAGARSSNSVGIDWPAIASAAGAVLSPGQVAALEGVRKSFEYNQAVQRLGQAAAGSAGGPQASSSSSPR